MKDEGYKKLVNDILSNDEFKKLKKYKHHGDNRMDHCIRVSYYSYCIAKKLKFKYKEVARAGLLHDFFLVNNQKLKFIPRVNVLFNHPKMALANSKKYFKLSKLEEDVILSHMFPIGLKFPRYKESWVVNLLDDYFSIYEKIHSIVKQICIVFKKLI